MATTRRTGEDNAVPFDSAEFDAGYIARLAGEPKCLGATPGWRAGWDDADAGRYSSQDSSFMHTA